MKLSERAPNRGSEIIPLAKLAFLLEEHNHFLAKRESIVEINHHPNGIEVKIHRE